MALSIKGSVTVRMPLIRVASIRSLFTGFSRPITRENFPGSGGALRIVALVSLILMLLTVGSAIYTGATHEEDHPEGQDSALLLPL